MRLSHLDLLFSLRKDSRSLFVFLSLFIVFVAVLVPHLIRLDAIPSGLFIDESAIGYNAALIAKTGKDEYGIHLPLFFRSFDDFKAPIYIYTVALFFKIFGVSPFVLRLSSFFFFATFLISSYLFVRKLFDGVLVVSVYALLAASLSPHFFVLSRLGFEVISQLALTSLYVPLVYCIFRENSSLLQPGRLRAFLSYSACLVCGVFLGVSVYSYPTARLLSFIAFFSLWLTLCSRRNILRLSLISASFAASIAPYLLYARAHGGDLVARFKTVSYLYADSPLLNKLALFCKNYITYFSPDYLLIKGDPNLRHSTGYGGVLFGVTILLFIVGLLGLFFARRSLLGPCERFLLVNTLASPAAAAMTSEGTPHALRAALLSYYVLLISCYGLFFLGAFLRRGTGRSIVYSSILLVLLVNAAAYQYDYFFRYPKASAVAMGSAGMVDAIRFSASTHPRKIDILDYSDPYLYAHVGFYRHSMLGAQGDPPLLLSGLDDIGEPGSCLIYPKSRLDVIASLSRPFRQMPEDSSEAFGLSPSRLPRSVFAARCYS